MATEAKLELAKMLGDEKISIGFKFDHRGYILKVHQVSNRTTIPNSILGVPIEIEITGKIII